MTATAIKTQPTPDYSWSKHNANSLRFSGCIEKNPRVLLQVTGLSNWNGKDYKGAVWGDSGFNSIAELREFFGYILMRDLDVSLSKQDAFIKEHNPRCTVCDCQSGHVIWFRLQDSDDTITELVLSFKDARTAAPAS